MPNWCSNTVDISANKKDINTYKDFLKVAFDPKADVIKNPVLQFNKILPEPDNITDWYQWRLSNWGCKWDINPDDFEITYQTETTISMNFLTPWGPPEGIYNQIISKWPTLYVDWFYHEPGMRLAGYLGDT